jgi:hypothetical protein
LDAKPYLFAAGDAADLIYKSAAGFLLGLHRTPPSFYDKPGMSKADNK